MNKELNFVPLGSVVLLKGGLQKVMIVSRGLLVKNNGNEVFFDYGGVAYPDGLISDQMAYFQHDAISMVVFEGYNDAENKNVIRNINEYLKNNPNVIRGTAEKWKSEN